MLMCAIHRSAALHPIDEPVAVAASKQPTCTIELGDLATAIHTVCLNVADEPRPLTTEAARSPLDWHALMDGLPILAARSDAVVESDGISPACNGDKGRGMAPLTIAMARPRQKARASQLHHIE
jgi:hypothetical protein